ncbi:MAG: chitobiase/beta-hexosaminidase C-terminal domain-containing protein [Flavobacteriales bacterium]|nr:chitobiase/beta-hexosaminidase C-terminal domain-containing protein [Flavobacteriales bacterium]
MKKTKNSLLFSLILSSSILATAQTEPTKPTFEKKVFLKNGNTYIQKELPLYLKFSTEPSGKNYDLKSKATPEYADPMYLDTEGINYVRTKWAVDKNTKKTIEPKLEVLYEVYADGLAPKSSSKFSGAPTYNNGSVQFYGKGLNVDLSSRDGVSGVEKTHFSLDGEAYKTYGTTLTFNGDKAHSLFYFANDNVGNAEKTRSKSFTVDISPPSSSHEIVGIVHNSNIISPSTKFKLSSNDALSGVRKTSYNYDSRAENSYPGYPVSVSYLKDGEHTLHYHSVDKVKNDETAKSFKFYLDKIAPVVAVTIQGDQHATGNTMYVSSRTKINMTATDNKAGVESINYKIGGSSYEKFGSPFGIPTKNGIHNVVYYSVDNVENRTASKTVASAIGNKHVFMDNKAPTTGISYSSPKFFDRDTLFINSKTNVKLTSRDYNSGVQKVEYTVNGSSNTTYSDPFNISNEGNHTIKFKATDKVNNVEQEKESHVFVDNTPPVIYHNFSIKSIGSKKKKGQVVQVYPNYTRLYLGATDQHCGTEKISYSLNGGEFLNYSSPYTLDVSEVGRFGKNKFYTVVIRADDKLGNQSEETITFFVGE